MPSSPAAAPYNGLELPFSGSGLRSSAFMANLGAPGLIVQFLGLCGHFRRLGLPNSWLPRALFWGWKTMANVAGRGMKTGLAMRST
ncbi:MAG: hypothetical protein RLZZ165_2207 [Bacteroidota bacterium]